MMTFTTFLAKALQLVLFSLFFLSTIVGLAHAQQPNDPEAVAVEAQVQKFYSWYLGVVEVNGDPLGKERTTLEKFASKTLLAELDKLIANDDLSEDHFLRAQDTFDDWSKSIAISKINVKASTATVDVTLGVKEKNKHRLFLTMVKESDVWKIRKVKHIPRRAKR
jgi:hypothetical protein